MVLVALLNNYYVQITMPKQVSVHLFFFHKPWFLVNNYFTIWVDILATTWVRLRATHLQVSLPSNEWSSKHTTNSHKVLLVSTFLKQKTQITSVCKSISIGGAKSHIAIFSTTNTKKHATMVVPLLNFLVSSYSAQPSIAVTVTKKL